MRTDLVETHAIEYFLSYHLIPLDKIPGLWAIEVGEILRRITSKLIVSVLKKDVIKYTGTLQVCAGQKAGIEAAIHSVNMKYKDQSTDASNVFSSLSRQSFLHHVSYQ